MNYDLIQAVLDKHQWPSLEFAYTALGLHGSNRTLENFAIKAHALFLDYQKKEPRKPSVPSNALLGVVIDDGYGFESIERESLDVLTPITPHEAIHGRLIRYISGEIHPIAKYCRHRHSLRPYPRLGLRPGWIPGKLGLGFEPRPSPEKFLETNRDKIRATVEYIIRNNKSLRYLIGEQPPYPDRCYQLGEDCAVQMCFHNNQYQHIKHRKYRAVAAEELMRREFVARGYKWVNRNSLRTVLDWQKKGVRPEHCIHARRAWMQRMEAHESIATPVQLEALRQLRSGKTTREIAKLIGASKHTTQRILTALSRGRPYPVQHTGRYWPRYKLRSGSFAAEYAGQLRSATPFQRRVFNLMLSGGVPQSETEIASKVGVSRSTVHRALESLKDGLPYEPSWRLTARRGGCPVEEREKMAA